MHGSIRPSTLRLLAQSKGVALSPRGSEKPRDVADCFELFRAVHVAIDCRDALKRVVAEVLEDFMNQYVVYLELRTTPRELPADGTSKAQYLQLVVSLLAEHNKRNGHVMQARLLVSVDRGQTVAGNAELEGLLRNVLDEADVIVGVDFSGDPSSSGGRFERYVPLLEQWKSSGVARHFSVHAAELEDPGQSVQCAGGIDVDGGCAATQHEFDSILAFQPDRLGHALYLLPRHVTTLLVLHQQHRQFTLRQAEEREEREEEVWVRQGAGHGSGSGSGSSGSGSSGSGSSGSDATAAGTGFFHTWPPPPLIEVCPTSNRVVMNHSSYAQHPHLRTWIDSGYPIAISTDDAGVFETTLTQEFLHVSTAFNLTMVQIVAIAAQPLDYIFCPEVKKQVAQRFAAVLFAARTREPPVLPPNVVALL